MNQVQQTIQCLEKKIEKIFSTDSSGHDIHHLKRTLNIALEIQKNEGGDRLVVAVASFLHDIHRIMQNETGKYCHPKDSLPVIREILNSVDLSQERIEKILCCVELHEEYNFSNFGKTAVDIEAFIVQDADNLDAIGAMGIARVFAFGGSHGIPIWRPEVPLPVVDNWDETNPQSASQIHHFYEKLLRLRDNMNTPTAKIMAAHRHSFMENYLQEFFKEWEGKL